MRSKFAPLTVGLTVLLTGFLPLALLWRFGGYTHPRGLFYYDSASWGDGLLLPLAAAALVWLNQQLPFTAGGTVRAIGALAGFAAGVGVVSSWITDSEAVSNWTMPEAHELNFPGYLHAGFLIGASTLFAALWTEFFVSLRKAFSVADESGGRVLGSGGFALAVGTSLAFGLLAVRDNVGAVELTDASRSSVLALVAAVLVLAVALAWAARKAAGSALAAVITGGLFAGAVGQVSLLTSPDTVVIPFVIAAAAFGLAVGITPEQDQMDPTTGRLSGGERPSAGIEMIAVPSVFILLPVNVGLIDHGGLLDIAKAGVWLVLGLVLVALIWWTRREQHDLGKDAQWFFTATIFVTASSGALAFSRTITDQETAGASTSLAFALLATLLAGPAMRLCDADLQRIVSLELTVQTQDNRDFTRLETLQRRHSYSRLAASGTAAIFSIIGLTILTGHAVGWLPGEASQQWTGMGLALAAAFGLSTVLLLHSLHYSSHGSDEAAHGGGEPAGFAVPPIGRATALLMMCSSGLVLILGAVISSDRPLDWYAGALSLCIAAFGGNCVLGNGLRVGLVRPTAASWFLISCVTSGIFAVVYWTLTEGIGTTAAPAMLGKSALTLLAGILISGLLMVSGTVTVVGHREDANRRYGVRLQDAFQDFLMLATMWTLMAWLPRLISAHIPEQSVPQYKWVMAATIFAGFLALYVSALLWIIKINDGHVGRKMISLGILPDPHFAPDAHHWARLRSIRHRLPQYFAANTEGTRAEREARALATHTAAQNTLSLGLVALTVSGLLWLAIADWES